MQQLFGALGSRDAAHPYLTNWGKGITIIARALQGGEGVKEIPHRVVMDEAEVLLATRAVALCLEPVDDLWLLLASGLDLIAELYRARGNVKKAAQLNTNATDAREDRVQGTSKCPPAVKAILEQLQSRPLTGKPGQDWLAVRHLLEKSGITELQLVARQAIYLMGCNRGRQIADALA